MYSRSWCEIDLTIMKDNYLRFCELLAPKQRIMAVVKANAYGHGGVEISRVLQNAGCKAFAVALASEAIELRRNGIIGDILVLGYTPVNEIKALADMDISQSVYSTDYADEVIKACNSLKVHLAIDTGMRRYGFDASDKSLPSMLDKYLNCLNVQGIFTHLSRADCSKESKFTAKQIEKFKKTIDILELKPRCVHYANTSGFLKYNDNFANFVRVGIGLYGLGENLPKGATPALTWKSQIVDVRKVKRGDCVGYGKGYKVKKGMKIATVSTGYADGYSRALSNRGVVKIGNRFAKIVGNVCMDAFMIDVTQIESVSLGDEVILLGEGLCAGDMAKRINTIDYEIVTKISQRVERFYKKY